MNLNFFYNVFIMNDLTWQMHYSKTVKRASKIKIYVIPILTCCCFVWSPIYTCDMDLIANILRAFTRRVSINMSQRICLAQKVASHWI